MRISPKPIDGKIRVTVDLGHSDQASKKWALTVDAIGSSLGNEHDPKALELSGTLPDDAITEVQFEYTMGDNARRWDEFEPNLYRINFKLNAGNYYDETERVFGLRDITIQGKHFAMNGTKTFMRGNVDCAVMPATGYAPMDVEAWRKVFQAYKDVGLNLARFHSWCPPEAAFAAADELGIYLAPEVGEWADIVSEDQFDYLRAESHRILDTFGHHPSFVMMALGNEIGGSHAFFAEILDGWKAADDARFYSIKANSYNPPNADFVVHRGTGENRSIKLRYQSGWPPLPDRTEFNAKPPHTSIDWGEATALFDTPIMQHETGQVCTYPDVKGELAKFTGYLRPSYLEIARDQLKSRGMWNQVPDFVQASGKWQMELTREEFEASFRTPGLAGYQWLALSDFTGQSSAPVGFVDAFYDPKPFFDPAKMRRWNAPTVVLARMPERILTQGETFTADIEVSHFGKKNLLLDDSIATLRGNDGRTIKQWNLSSGTFKQGGPQAVDTISMKLSIANAPEKLNLSIESKRNNIATDYNIWVYPNDPAPNFPSGVHISHTWDSETQSILKKGGTVLLLPRIGEMKGDLPSCFTNHHWTSVRAKGGQSASSGILIDPEHPLMAEFPTDNHVNWNWWDILNHCQPMILDSYDSTNAWPKDYHPLIQPVDSWKINRKLALVAELKFGAGKLLICSIDIESDLEKRPATRQFRKSLLLYISSSDFNPQRTISAAAIAEVFQKDNKPIKKLNFAEENLPNDN